MGSYRTAPWIAVLPLALLPLLAPGCARAPVDTLARVRAEKAIRIGTDATYPPFETIDPATKQVVGFDADLMRAVGRRLGAEARFLVVPFDGILGALNAGKYDAVISALTITDERAREVLFSEPYYAAGQSIVARAGSAVHSAADLAGGKIGVQLGTTGEREAHRIVSANAGGGGRAEVVSFDAIGAAFMDLASGRLDAVIADTPTAALFVRDHPEVAIVGAPITRESYGIALRKSDANLKSAIDEALAELTRDGTIASLREKWSLPGP